MIWLEIVASVFTLISVVFYRLKKQNGWVFNVISSVLLIILFYRSNITGQMILSILYLLMGVIGLDKWKGQFIINKNKSYSINILFFCIGTMITSLGVYLHRGYITIPELDVIIIILSILANILLITKSIENWIIWIFINVLSIILFMATKMYILTGLYVFFLYNAIHAYISWNKEYKLNLKQ